jgi:transcriptional regulator with XRE-family HTH domain
MPRSDEPRALGELIRERREELDMTQEAVGLAAGTDQARISRIEAGESPRVALFQSIARALDWSGVELMRRLEEREATQSNVKSNANIAPDEAQQAYRNYSS